MAGKKKVVYLGLSGGVDSAVAAALLLRRDFDVVPIFLKCWEDSSAGCPWEEDQAAAFEVAKKLGIAKNFQSWNFSNEFFENVVSYIVEEARAGRTGNPDVVCNKIIKFGAFLKRALGEGADFVATGHYARISLASTASDREIQRPDRASGQAIYQLLSPLCEAKNDQTYFLWQLNQEQLSRAIFPIGEFKNKAAVRQEALKLGLPSAERKSTRGICFVGNQSYSSFLQNFLEQEDGEVVTAEGKVVGRHQGLPFYTFGQRKGIGITDAFGPYYVTAKDYEKNQLVVAPVADAGKLWQKRVNIGKVNWISGKEPIFPISCSAFIRHPQKETTPCVVLAGDGGILEVNFVKPQWALTPGQSVVFYKGDLVLGGGTIAG